MNQYKCLCGKCTIEIPQTKELFSVYCHCKICQKYYGTNYIHLIGYKTDQIKIDHLKNNISGYSSSKYVTRYSCSDCNCPIYTECTFPRFPFINVTSSVVGGVDVDSHIFYRDRVCDVDDNLVKYTTRFGKEKYI